MTTSRKTTRKKPATRAQQAAVQMPSNSLATTTGVVRSTPSRAMWTSKTLETMAQSRDRVIVSRFLQETLPFAFYLTHTLPEEAVGKGIGLKSTSRNAEFSRRATEYFRRWADSEAVDLRKEHTFYSLQSLWLSAILGDGECFVQKVAGGAEGAETWSLSDTSKRKLQLQTFTRDQLSSGKALPGERWHDGIRVNGLMQSDLYRVQTEGISQTEIVTRDILAPFMKHLKRTIRPNQVHGVPWMFCGASDLLDALDMKAVRKHAAKIKSAFLGATVTRDGEVPAAFRTAMTKGESGTPPADNGQRFVEIFGGAVMVPLAADEDVKWFQAQEAMNYGQFIEELVSPMVFSFGYPPEYLLSPKMTGPSQRAILSKVRKAHGKMRELLQPVLRWVWEWVIGDAMVNGPLAEFASVEDWNVVDYVADPDPSIDLGRDERAEMEKLRANAATMEDYVEQHTGGSGRDTRRKRIEEKVEDMVMAKEIAAAAGLDEKLTMLAVLRAIDPAELSAMSGVLKALEVDPASLAGRGDPGGAD